MPVTNNVAASTLQHVCGQFSPWEWPNSRTRFQTSVELVSSYSLTPPINVIGKIGGRADDGCLVDSMPEIIWPKFGLLFGLIG